LVGQQLSVPLKELKQLTNSTITKESAKLCKVSLKAILGDIHRTELAIKELINNDEELKRMVSLMTSIQGVGQITACEVILTTNEFKDIKQARQYACYAGVAPFEHSSGKKQSRARVSHMANKKVKKLLHLAAMAAIRCNKDLKTYYTHKVQEGKNKMLVINAVRNKLIHRLFACVKNNCPCMNTYLSVAV
jgi:transposase